MAITIYSSIYQHDDIGLVFIDNDRTKLIARITVVWDKITNRAGAMEK